MVRPAAPSPVLAALHGLRRNLFKAEVAGFGRGEGRGPGREKSVAQIEANAPGHNPQDGQEQPQGNGRTLVQVQGHDPPSAGVQHVLYDLNCWLAKERLKRRGGIFFDGNKQRRKKKKTGLVSYECSWFFAISSSFTRSPLHPRKREGESLDLLSPKRESCRSCSGKAPDGW